MCHVSELMNRRVENVTDLVQEGDMMAVKVLGIDDKGKVKLSRSRFARRSSRWNGGKPYRQQGQRVTE